jgi:DNA recombination protein RmuC
VDAYNKAVGSYDTRILPGARKFTEMGVAAKKEAPKLEQIERATRQIEAREDTDNRH